MRKMSRLTAGLLCAALTAALVMPASAYGCHGGRGRRGGCRQQVQAAVTVCPYEDCTLTGRHTHDGVIYCGRCDGSCAAEVPCGCHRGR